MAMVAKLLSGNSLHDIRNTMDIVASNGSGKTNNNVLAQIKVKQTPNLQT